MCCDVSKGIHHVIAYFAGVKGQIEKNRREVRNEATYVCECISDSYIARTSLMVCGLVERK